MRGVEVENFSRASANWDNVDADTSTSLDVKAAMSLFQVACTAIVL